MMTAARMHTPIAIRGASRFFLVGGTGAGATGVGASVVIGHRLEQCYSGCVVRLAGDEPAPLAKSGWSGGDTSPDVSEWRDRAHGEILSPAT
jgi:hypothetical protein